MKNLPGNKARLGPKIPCVILEAIEMPAAGHFAAKVFTLVLAATLLAGCAINPHQNCCDPVPQSDIERKAQQAHYSKLIADYQIPSNGPIHWDRPLFRFSGDHNISSAPAILLLHEYPYLTPNSFELAKKLAREGFTVYLPTLFGRPLVNDSFGNSFYLLVSPDWYVTFNEHNTSPIIDKIRKLACAIDEVHGRRGIGVIGQCLTGAFPLALLSEPCVKAVVCAQPSTPLLTRTSEAKRSFGLSRHDILCAQNSPVKIFSLRFEGDMVSPVERLITLKETFPNALDPWIIDTPTDYSGILWNKYGIGPQAHPTLTYCLPKAEENDRHNPVNIAFAKVVAYLHQNLHK